MASCFTSVPLMTELSLIALPLLFHKHLVLYPTGATGVAWLSRMSQSTNKKMLFSVNLWILENPADMFVAMEIT